MDSIMFRLSLSLLLCVRVCVRIHQGLGHSLQRANYCGTYERHPEEAEEKDPHAALRIFPTACAPCRKGQHLYTQRT